jgi:hypothetical protein
LRRAQDRIAAYFRKGKTAVKRRGKATGLFKEEKIAGLPGERQFGFFIV